MIVVQGRAIKDKGDYGNVPHSPEKAVGVVLFCPTPIHARPRAAATLAMKAVFSV